jgi:hypothetical protein
MYVTEIPSPAMLNNLIEDKWSLYTPTENKTCEIYAE